MRELTYNEAAVEAIAEEMRRDPKIFYMSTDALPPLLKEFGPTADQGDADHRGGADRHGDRRRRLRLPPDRGLAAGDVLLCRDGPDRQSGRKIHYMFGGQVTSRSCFAPPSAAAARSRRSTRSRRIRCS